MDLHLRSRELCDNGREIALGNQTGQLLKRYFKVHSKFLEQSTFCITLRIPCLYFSAYYLKFILKWHIFPLAIIFFFFGREALGANYHYFFNVTNFQLLFSFVALSLAIKSSNKLQARHLLLEKDGYFKFFWFDSFTL